jgi:hypothetical protein
MLLTMRQAVRCWWVRGVAGERGDAEGRRNAEGIIGED